MDIKTLKSFLTELAIEENHQTVIFETLEKIKENGEACELFFSFYTPYKEKGELDYDVFYKESLPKLWELLPEIHKYTINLAVLFALVAVFAAIIGVVWLGFGDVIAAYFKELIAKLRGL